MAQRVWRFLPLASDFGSARIFAKDVSAAKNRWSSGFSRFVSPLRRARRLIVAASAYNEGKGALLVLLSLYAVFKFFCLVFNLFGPWGLAVLFVLVLGCNDGSGNSGSSRRERPSTHPECYYRGEEEFRN